MKPTRGLFPRVSLLRSPEEKTLRSQEIVDVMMRYRGYSLEIALADSKPDDCGRKSDDNAKKIDALLVTLTYAYSSKKSKSSTPKVTPNIVCLWVTDLGVGVTHLIYEKIKLEGVKHLLVVVQNKITSQAAKTLENIGKVDKIRIEIFYESQLQFDPTQHVDVPKLSVCSPQEKKALLEGRALVLSNIAKFKTDDIIVKFIGATRGNLVKIKIPKENPVKRSESQDERQTPKTYYDVEYRVVV